MKGSEGKGGGEKGSVGISDASEDIARGWWGGEGRKERREIASEHIAGEGGKER